MTINTQNNKSTWITAQNAAIAIGIMYFGNAYLNYTSGNYAKTITSLALGILIPTGIYYGNNRYQAEKKSETHTPENRAKPSSTTPAPQNPSTPLTKPSRILEDYQNSLRRIQEDHQNFLRQQHEIKQQHDIEFNRKQAAQSAAFARMMSSWNSDTTTTQKENDLNKHFADINKGTW